MSCLLLVLAAISGCGDANGGTGGSGGTPAAQQSAYSLRCTIDTLDIDTDDHGISARFPVGLLE